MRKRQKCMLGEGEAPSKTREENWSRGEGDERGAPEEEADCINAKGKSFKRRERKIQSYVTPVREKRLWGKRVISPV